MSYNYIEIKVSTKCCFCVCADLEQKITVIAFGISVLQVFLEKPLFKVSINLIVGV